MDERHLNAFVQALEKVFATMLSTDVQILEPADGIKDSELCDVWCAIELSGDVDGTVSVGLPTEVAERITSLFSDTPLSMRDDGFADALGELVNMIAGNAKAAFEGRKISIGCPRVFAASHSADPECQAIPSMVLLCCCDCGDFFLKVAIRESDPIEPQTQSQIVSLTRQESE